MKRPLFGFALVLVVALTAGCMHSARQPYMAATMPRSRAFALAVTVNGSLQPTPMQWSVVQAKFADEFATRGWVLVTDLALADYIVRVDFTPDPTDPENNGHAVVVGVRDNPRKLLAGMTTISPVSRYPTSFGYSGTFQNALWSPGYSSLYSGWGDAYYDGYSYSSPTLNPVKPPVVVTQPPNRPYRHHHQPGDPAYCPPERDRKLPPVANLLPGDFAAATPPAQSNTFASRDRSGGTNGWSRSSSGSTSSRSDSNSSGYGRGQWGGDSTQSRAGTSYSRTDSSAAGSRSDSSSSGSRTYSRGDSSSSSSRGDNTYSRGGNSSGSRSDSSSPRSDSSYSRSGSDSGSSYSRSGSSNSSSSGSSHSSSSSSGSSSSSSPAASSSSSSGSSGPTGGNSSTDSSGRVAN
jgi:hypothetical protein